MTENIAVRVQPRVGQQVWYSLTYNDKTYVQPATIAWINPDNQNQVHLSVIMPDGVAQPRCNVDRLQPGEWGLVGRWSYMAHQLNQHAAPPPLYAVS